MIKRLFGMHHLNITQGRYTGLSHQLHNAYDLAGSDSGIDFYKATSPLKVIGIHKYNNGTGFANTIHFYDEENDVTLAMTHMNIINGNWWVGKVFNIGEVCYMEGTTGFATGNHIHLEIGRGFQSTKIQFKKGKWGLKNWINFEDYFYIDETITVVNCLYLLEHSEKKKGENLKMNLNNGLNKIVINHKQMNIYKLSKDEDICLLSATQAKKENWEALERIHTINDNSKNIKCKINGGFFDLNSGQHYGVEQSEINDFAPKSNKYLVFYEYLENGVLSWNWCGADQYHKSKAEVQWALTPFAIINKYGQIAYSKAYENEYNKKPHSRSFYMWLKDNGRAIGVCASDIAIQDFYTLFKDIAEVIVVFDGGGSTQMEVKQSEKMVDVLASNRKIANSIIAFEKNNPTPPKESIGQTESTETIQLPSENETLKKALKQAIAERDIYKEKMENIKEIING